MKVLALLLGIAALLGSALFLLPQHPETSTSVEENRGDGERRLKQALAELQVLKAEMEANRSFPPAIVPASSSERRTHSGCDSHCVKLHALIAEMEERLASLERRQDASVSEGTEASGSVWVGLKRAYGPEQATGRPDTREAGDRPTAWASLTPDEEDEWLLLEYGQAITPTRIDVYESFRPGALYQVSVFKSDGTEILVWSGVDPTPSHLGSGVSPIPVSIDFKTRKVKLYLSSRATPGWNEIDAVALVDATGRSYWANEASASSTYAERHNSASGNPLFPFSEDR